VRGARTLQHGLRRLARIPADGYSRIGINALDSLYRRLSRCLEDLRHNYMFSSDDNPVDFLLP